MYFLISIRYYDSACDKEGQGLGYNHASVSQFLADVVTEINFFFSENAIVLFFLMEYLVRFICSPRKWRFFKQPMNLVDFFAIIPFMLDLVIGGLQVQ